MAINETQLNGRVATLLDRMNVRWDVHAEMKGAFVNAQTQPDILVLPKGGSSGGLAVVIENEYLPARTLEGVKRLRGWARSWMRMLLVWMER